MSFHITINAASARPKYQQIADSLLDGIKSKMIGVDQQLPSINEISAQYDVSRDTVERAYKILKRDGIIQSVRGKGYYAISNQKTPSRRVMVLFNKLSDHKREIFLGLAEDLSQDAQLDLQIYHDNFRTFKRLIETHSNSFSDFVIICNFLGNTAIKAKQLVTESLSGKNVVFVSSEVKGISSAFGSVTQDYRSDIIKGLSEAKTDLDRYSSIHLLFDPDCAARGIIEGFEQWTRQHANSSEVITTEDGPDELLKGRVYVTVTDRQLVCIVKQARDQGLQLGVDVGLIAYNDSILKEVLADGITVLTTDHRFMGQKAAEMLQTKKMNRQRVSFRLIRRSTL